MCGICGIYMANSGPINRQLVTKMTELLIHRGPDGFGYYFNEKIGFGHRRLSIIDLEGGSQPISNEDESIHIIFNGEIYNFLELKNSLMERGHTFKTSSDTETIIHAYEEWGLDCLNLLNGIFAFALWDNNLKKLVLARDHLGIKPLYFINFQNKFLFASEIKSLLLDRDCPREVDLESLIDLFTFRYVPSPKTMFKDIRKLPPGHYLTISNETLHVERFWNKKPEIILGREKGSLVTEYQELLEDAVRLQLRSDVPIGLFLSSGIDSGALLSIMKNFVDYPIHTFTVGFENGEKTNELEGASYLANLFGAEHHDLIISTQDYVNYFDSFLWDIEEPLGNETAAAFYFLSKLAKDYVKVVLCGQGADEPWAGYPRHLGVKLSNYYSKLPKFFTEKFLNSLISIIPKNEKLKRGVGSLSEKDILKRFVKIYSFFNVKMKTKIFKDNVKENCPYEDFLNPDVIRPLFEDVDNLDPLNQMLYIDTRANLPDDLLMVTDKTAMANSIEARVPYLDYRIIEFIETLPSNLKLRGFTGKYLHKKALNKYVPSNVAYQKKKGFSNPINKWFISSMSSYVDEMLLSQNSAVRHYFNQDYISQILNSHRSGREEYYRHIFLLLSFELWHRKFIF